MKSKIKLRFSYFLVLGMIGIILQVISFFSWNKNNVTTQQLMGSDISYLKSFSASSYILLFSTIFFIIMAIGFVLCSKKNDFFIRSGSYILIGTQIIILIDLIVTLILVFTNQKCFYKDDGILKAMQITVSIRYVMELLSCISYILLSIGTLNIKRNDKLEGISSIISISCNAIPLIILFIIIILALSNSTYNLMTQFFEISKKVQLPYASSYGTMNSFTYGQLTRLISLSQEIESINSTNLSSLRGDTIFAIIGILSYCLSMIGNAIYIAIQIIISYDVEKDDSPMSIY